MSSKLKNASPVIMWLVMVVFYFYQFIARSSFPTVLTDEYMRHFLLDAAGVGTLASCYYFVYTFMQIPAGIIIDKYSTRMIGSVATGICALGVLVFIATTNCYVAGFGQMLVGFGSAFAFLLSLKTITNWFPANKITIMSSYTMSVGCLGPVVGGPLVSHLVKTNDWTNVMKVFGIAGLLFVIGVWMIIVDKKQKTEEQEHISLWDSMKIIFSSKQAWILALYAMMMYAPLSALGDLWGIAFIKNAYGVDSTVAAFANNMIYVGMVIGSPLFAYLAILMDSYKKPMLIGAVLATIALGIVIMCSGVPIEAVFVLFFVTGFACGSMLGYPLAMTIFPKSIGATVSGFINMMSMVSGVILMPLIGFIINICWDGTIQNGIKVYHVSDYRLGLTSVVVFLALGIILAAIMEDHSPKKR